MTKRVPRVFLLCTWLFLAATARGEEHPLLTEMTERFNDLTNYTALLDSEGENSRNRVLYTYKKPGFIQMDFIRPHRGARLIFDPTKNRVTLRPFSTRLITLDLSPDNRLITAPRGHTVDQSDLGALIRPAKNCAKKGRVTTLPPELVEGLPCPRLMIECAQKTYILWIHPRLRLPIKIQKIFSGGTRETVFLRTLAVDVPLDDTVFKP
ncbi:MAG: hypothetical protein GY737_14615 [Desulfobacteraceae bacterium]|nr:hypothetical protein [Desulfobacteraceae bacterium]